MGRSLWTRLTYANVVASLALVVALGAATPVLMRLPGYLRQFVGSGEPSVVVDRNESSSFRTSPTVRQYTGRRTTVTEGLSSFNKTVRAVDAGGSKPSVGTFDKTPVQCHGGMASVVWHVGNLEPTTPETGIHLSIFMDGERIGSLLKGSYNGVWEDGPEEIYTVVRCPRGPHTFYAAIDSLGGGWGIPYANEGDLVKRGLIITENW